jgi:hypothetical protein
VPILTRVDAAVHTDAFASDISAEVTQKGINDRALISRCKVVEQWQAE